MMPDTASTGVATRVSGEAIGGPPASFSAVAAGLAVAIGLEVSVEPGVARSVTVTLPTMRSGCQAGPIAISPVASKTGVGLEPSWLIT
jgi:hypothetical protein